MLNKIDIKQPYYKKKNYLLVIQHLSFMMQASQQLRAEIFN
ncbi:hypothetical protein T12_3399 [Trichinella patagoniensis]|uniref:Uncharacterized protein n=1 Tax=Trichinella patagoniensis TaxID=990121 RepID=A0A0V0XDD8_9BILA|nr:hypothetical protein T12_3399 [Trichinella patagoniensis]